MDRKIKRKIGSSICIDADIVPDCSGKEGTEPKGRFMVNQKLFVRHVVRPHQKSKVFIVDLSRCTQRQSEKPTVTERGDT